MIDNMADSESPWELLDLLEGRCEVPDEVQRLRIFQENCCEALAANLPAEAEGWLKVARAYRFGEATSRFGSRSDNRVGALGIGLL